jgi:muconolactone delta-isomerase
MAEGLLLRVWHEQGSRFAFWSADENSNLENTLTHFPKF